MAEIVNYLQAQNMRLEEEIVKRNLVHPDALHASRLEADITGDDIGIVLVRNGFIRQAELINLRIELDPANLSREQVVIGNVPYDFLERTRTILVAETDDKIYASSLSPEVVVESGMQEYDSREIEFVPLSLQDLQPYLDEVKRLQMEGDAFLLEQIIRTSLHNGVSDIHIRPRERSYTIFTRKDGVTKIFREGRYEEYLTLNSRIKDLAGIDMSEKRISQSGKFQIEHKRKSVDLRVETLPTVCGETIVIRLLDPDAVIPVLDRLGITDLPEWRKGVNRANGLCLICGPTGSGKSTTLNATLREMDRFGKAIYTIEDPVEYRVPYISQVSVAGKMTFAKGMRSFLRADPEIIVLGEVRDEETASYMIKAAETGHMVVATLHTESIYGVASRLREIGVREHDLRHMLRSVLVQNLIRKTCTSCHGEGCDDCLGEGYKGRTIVSECAYFKDEADVSMMLEGKSWWTPIVTDAAKKAHSGITNAKEVRRAYGEDGIRRLDELAKADSTGSTMPEAA